MQQVDWSLENITAWQNNGKLSLGTNAAIDDMRVARDAWLAGVQDSLHGSELFAVNISGHSLGNSRFADFVLEQLHHSGISAGNICFEITESAAVTHLKQESNFIDALKERGAYFALDEFGSGLSSFGFLKSIRVDFLKLDGSLVRDIARDPIDMQMVRAINDVGHLIGMRTIAEWVECDAVVSRLRALGVDFMHGDVIGKPVPLTDLPLSTQVAASGAT